MSRPPWTINNRVPEDKIPQFPDTIVIGDFRINTTSTGALETKPVSAPAEQEPADVAQPASLVLGETDINLVASAQFGGNILLTDLLNALLDVPNSVSIGLETMSVRSALGRLFSSFAGVSAEVADLSGVRIPAVLNEVVNNASLDEARALAQSLKDAAQDASGALVELASASAAASISALEGRLTAVEGGLGAVDLSGVFTRLDGAESMITSLANGKVDVTTYEAALPGFATATEMADITNRVMFAEGSIAGNAGRLDAVEAALPTKVAQADYDVYVAATDAAVAAAAAAAGTAQSAAEAAQATADAAEVKGFVSKLVVEDNSTSGVSQVYWIDSQAAVLAGIMDSGKIASYMFDPSFEGEPHPILAIPSDVASAAPVAGAVRRLRNAHPSAVLPISLGGVSYEIVPQETAVFQHNGTEWRLL